MSNKDTASAPPRRDGTVSMRDRASLPIDLSVLAEISGGNRSAEIRMLSAFRKSNRADAAELRDAIERADIVTVARVSHRLVGAGRIAGASALASICEAIERAALARDWDGVAANSNACYRELERVNAYICTLAEIQSRSA